MYPNMLKTKLVCPHNISALPTMLHAEKRTENKSVLWFTQRRGPPNYNKASRAYDIA